MNNVRWELAAPDSFATTENAEHTEEYLVKATNNTNKCEQDFLMKFVVIIM
jgi:hypothetical protein